MPSLLTIDTCFLHHIFDMSHTWSQFRLQWSQPGSILHVLMIVGGDDVGRALAQLAGMGGAPVAFSFGENPSPRVSFLDFRMSEQHQVG